MTNTDKVINIVQEESGHAGISIATNLDSLELDSISLLQLFHRVCDEVKEIPVEKWSNINTVADILREMDAHLPN